MNLAHQHFSAAQMDVVCHAIKMYKFIRRINLSECGLQKGMLAKVLAAIDPFSVTELNISRNQKLNVGDYTKL